MMHSTPIRYMRQKCIPECVALLGSIFFSLKGFSTGDLQRDLTHTLKLSHIPTAREGEQILLYTYNPNK